VASLSLPQTLACEEVAGALQPHLGPGLGLKVRGVRQLSTIVGCRASPCFESHLPRSTTEGGSRKGDIAESVWPGGEIKGAIERG
jgi:hypothetical protein